MSRVTIAQRDGATTLRAPPAPGWLAAMRRREAGLADAVDVLGHRHAAPGPP